METIRNFGARAMEYTADSMNPANKIICEATPEGPGQVPFFVQQQIVEQSYQGAEPGRDQMKFLMQRMESGGVHCQGKVLTIVRALVQDGSPNFVSLLKQNTHAISRVATSDTRRDTVEEANKLAAQGILASIGQAVQVQDQQGGRYGGISSHDPRPAATNKGKTQWQEMQEQQLREQRRREKETKTLKERKLAERAEELKREAVTFDLVNTPSEKVVEKLMGGTRKKVPLTEMEAFSAALQSVPHTFTTDDILSALCKKLADDNISTRFKALEILAQVLRDERPSVAAVVGKHIKRLCAIRDARGGVGLEKKTAHCAELATEVLQLAEVLRAKEKVAAASVSVQDESLFAFANAGNSGGGGNSFAHPVQQQPHSPFAAILEGSPNGGSWPQQQQNQALQQQLQQAQRQREEAEKEAALRALQEQQQQLQLLQQQAAVKQLQQQQQQQQQLLQQQQQQQQEEAEKEAALRALQEQQQQLQLLQQQAAVKQLQQQQHQQQLLQQQQHQQQQQAREEAEKEAALRALQEQQQQLQMLQQQAVAAQRQREEAEKEAELKALQQQQEQDSKRRQQEELKRQMDALQQAQQQLQMLQMQQQQPLPPTPPQPQPTPPQPPLADFFSDPPAAPAAAPPPIPNQPPPLQQPQLQQQQQTSAFDPFSSLMDFTKPPTQSVPQAPVAAAPHPMPSHRMPTESSIDSSSPLGSPTGNLQSIEQQIKDAQQTLARLQPAYNTCKGLPLATPLPDLTK